MMHPLIPAPILDIARETDLDEVVNNKVSETDLNKGEIAIVPKTMSWNKKSYGRPPTGRCNVKYHITKN